VEKFIGFEIDDGYLAEARNRLATEVRTPKPEIHPDAPKPKARKKRAPSPTADMELPL
jgi:hypothetical protein